MRHALLFLPIALAGCFPSAKPDFHSAEPAARNAAIVESAANSRHESIPDLIHQLESDDPATRMLAIRTLERLTGQTHGYDHADPEVRRERAIEAWVRWWNEQRAAEARATSVKMRGSWEDHPDPRGTNRR